MPLWRKKYTLRRATSQMYKDGHAIGGFEDTIVSLDVQPVPTTELEVLPEGERSKHRIKTFGDFVIQVADDNTGAVADLLFYSGIWYKCETADVWQGGRLDHCEAQFVELTGQADEPKHEANPDNLGVPPEAQVEPSGISKRGGTGMWI